jgi:colicin import membrane protein
MNALVTMEAILEPAAGVVLSAESIFGTGQAATIVAAIESQVRAEVFDITTEDGRERVKSTAYKIARSKTTLDEIGKEHVADIKAKSAAIDKERKTIRDRLDALKEEVRGPLTAWEEAEAERVESAEAALVFIVTAARWEAAPAAEHIRNRVQSVRDVLADHDWQEFRERADAAAADAIPALERMLAETMQRDADIAELAELRRLKAEREEADRIAAAAAQAAEKARQDSEQRAAREAAEAAQATERERQRQELAERDKAAAVAAAIEQERRRQEAEAARIAAVIAAEKAATEKRAANARRRAKVHTDIRAALTCPEIAPHVVDRIIDAIAAGDVPHVSITY